MYNICIFAGTTEGRKLIEFLGSQPVSVTACVATEYGETLLKPSENVTVSAKRLSKNEMIHLLKENHYDLVVDATHPYAADVTENIDHACKVTDTEYLRLLRGASSVGSEAVFVSDTAEAVAFLNNTDGNILLTTGSKDLSEYADIQNFAQRVYARVLPSQASLDACLASGIAPSHTIAMQGPFSEEINIAMLKSVSAQYMVTKDGGTAGGFDKKVSAAQKAGAQLIVIGRPQQKKGLAFSEIINVLCNRFGCISKPHITILGIGPGNHNAMTGEVRQAIAAADCLIGAKRMLDAVADSGKAAFEAISPDKIADFIMSKHEYHRFAVIMSGDTGFFSGTKKLLPLLKDCDIDVLPGLNSLAYLCSRLKISYEDISVISLHGRDYNIIPDIRANPRVFVLTGGEDGVNKLCRKLIDAGLGHLKMHIGEKLSYDDEKITSGTVSELSDGIYDTLSVVLLENEAPDAIITHGLPDEAFLRTSGADGIVPMTKSEVRSVCLSKLRLTSRSICWDIGAGSGSVAIELALMARRGQVYAIEKKEAAVELLQRNTAEFDLNNLTIISGTAPDICRELPSPTHVFIGGSSGNMKDIISLLLSKNPNVRIVATAISLETIAELTSCIKEFDFNEVVSINVSRNKAVGQYNLMTGQNPVYIFTMQNGGSEQ